MFRIGLLFLFTMSACKNATEKRSSGFPQMTRSDNNLVFACTDDKKTVKVGIVKL